MQYIEVARLVVGIILVAVIAFGWLAMEKGESILSVLAKAAIVAFLLALHSGINFERGVQHGMIIEEVACQGEIKEAIRDGDLILNKARGVKIREARRKE